MLTHRDYIILVAALQLFLVTLCLADLPPLNPNFSRKEQKSVRLPPCKSCTVLVESFRKGMEKTSRGKHDGGDAAWEEEKLRSYKTSEVRLVEIQESLCSDITRGQDQCHLLADENEEYIENWFFKLQLDKPDLFEWLCIEKLEFCCPSNHFGPKCDKCSDCSGNGECKGNGTRKGNGKCNCDTGYAGEQCNECAVQFYEAFRDDTKLLCSNCHTACGDGGCTGGGPKKCHSCKNGWSKNGDGGCVDANECIKATACRTDQFCVNNEGSYSCLECDKSCNGCTGDGPDLCLKCAAGFEVKDGICTDLTNEKRDQYVSFTRYLTYLGLCIAICVIFQSSTWIASVIGVAVAIYISASEYWLRTTPSSATPQIDTSQLEDIIKNSL